METPDEVLARLETMGEPRVRGLLAKNYFEARAVSLVEGWLTRKEQERAAPVEEEWVKPLDTVRTMADQASKDAARASHAAAQVNRLAVAALSVGSVALLVSIVALVLLALR